MTKSALASENIDSLLEAEAENKRLVYLFMKTSAFHLNLDLPEKYQSSLVGRNTRMPEVS